MGRQNGDDVFPNKLSHLGNVDGGDGFCLYPFCEIIHIDEQVLTLARGLRKIP